MKNIVPIVVVTFAIALLLGFALPSALKPAARTGPIKISDLPLNRAIRGVIPLTAGTYSCVLPAGIGCAITEIGGPPQSTGPSLGFGRLRVYVDGALIATTAFSLNCVGTTDRHFDPPIIVPPGSSLGFDWAPVYGANAPVENLQQLTIAGWSLLPGDI